MKVFKVHRKEALKYWLEETNRNQDFRTRDILYASYECKWQWFTSEEKHNNFCCSFGEFCNLVTDILTDKRFDNINLNNLKEYQESALFRYYMNFYLVIEQILDDFNYIKLGFKLHDPEDLKGFINAFIKHKNNKTPCFYKHNDHMRKTFEGDVVSGEIPLGLGNYKEFLETKDISKFGFFEVPSLLDGLSIIIKNYEKLDKHLEDTKNRKRFIKKYTN